MKLFRLKSFIIFFGLAAIFARAENFTGIKADLVVAPDGSGAVKTVSEAVGRVPENNKKRFVIFIKPGIYKEQIRIPANKPYISLIGESAETTKLTFNLSNKERRVAPKLRGYQF